LNANQTKRLYAEIENKLFDKLFRHFFKQSNYVNFKTKFLFKIYKHRNFFLF
jgi:hypothetical protein